MSAASEPGLIHLSSTVSVPETVARLETMARASGLHVFTRVDHAAAAAEAGLHMPPTQVLLLGNPAIGTPMMLAAPSLALDLPFKILVAQDAASSAVTVTINAPSWLAARHKVPPPLAARLNGIVDHIRHAISGGHRH